MAVSEIIGAAVGVILLVIVAYVIVSGTLYAGETMANAQKDMTLLQEARLRTAMTFTDLSNDSTSRYIVYGNLTNTGSEVISDFKHMDVISYDANGVYEICFYQKDNVNRGYWRISNQYDEIVHPEELDPGEVYQIEIRTTRDVPIGFLITSSNGASAAARL
jgi:archaeal flagellar protein FlaF